MADYNDKVVNAELVLPEGGGEALNLSGDTGFYTENTDSVNLLGDGNSTSPLKAFVRIDAADDNALLSGENGLSVGVSPVSDNLLVLAGGKLYVAPPQIVIPISAKSDNTLVDLSEEGEEGLYVPPAPQGPVGPQGPQGEPGVGIYVKGVLSKPEDLPAASSYMEGDTFVIGTHYYTVVNHVWKDLGDFAGPQGADGQDGIGLVIRGSFTDTALLPQEGNNEGDAYIIKEKMWVWTGDADGWQAVGQVGPQGPRGPQGIQGPQGEKGEKGDPGKDAVVFTNKGTLPAEEDLPQEGNTVADAYLIDNEVWMWDNNNQWRNLGSIQGAQGPEGPQGPVGPQGPQGPQGPAGQDGLTGPIGPQGPQGPVGPQGPQGFGVRILGTKGSQQELFDTPGSTGDAWMIVPNLWVWSASDGQWVDVGPYQGPQGPQGPAGKDGEPGAEGPPGPDGPQGPAGKDGEQGPVGPEGPQGPAGPAGADGDPGMLESYAVETIEGTTPPATFLQATIDAISAPKPGTAQGKRYQVGEEGAGESDYSGITTFPTQDGKYLWVFGRNALGDGELGAYIMFVPDDTQIQPSYLYYTRSVPGKDGSPGTGLIPKGVKATYNELPSTDNSVGDFWTVDETGKGYAWDGSTWVDVGTTRGLEGPTGPQGPEGPEGPQGPAGADGQTGPEGPEGPQGIQGVKGDQGTLWLNFSREPGPADGRIGDYFINKDTLEYYQKTSATAWASLGHLGGGNVYDTASTTPQARIGGSWVNVDVLEAPKDSGYYVRQNGAWKKLDRYDLLVTSTTGAMDVSVSQVFKVDGTASKTMSFTNLPTNRAMTIVIVFAGSGASLTWPSGLAWSNGTAPVLGTTRTVITILWDGTNLTGTTSLTVS